MLFCAFLFYQSTQYYVHVLQSTGMLFMQNLGSSTLVSMMELMAAWPISKSRPIICTLSTSLRIYARSSIKSGKVACSFSSIILSIIIAQTS